MTARALNVHTESPAAAVVRAGLTGRVVGQQEAIDALVAVTEKHASGLYDRTRPLASILLLGPTGSGKTRLTEAFTETLYGDPRQRLKVDCGEFQHSAEIAKLIGSPPGYLGHRQTPPLFNTERIQSLMGSAGKSRTPAIIIFDEIEKASDALWHLLLGVLDKGCLTTGYNEEVDLTHTIILMTSNAGSGEMDHAIGNGGLGFSRTAGGPSLAPSAKGGAADSDHARIAKIGVAAAKRKFTPEFVNRLDSVIACHALTRDQTQKVILMELARLQGRLVTHCTPPCRFGITDAARQAILDEGFDSRYNARNVRRVIDQRLQLPLGRIVAAGGVRADEIVSIDYDGEAYTFSAIIPNAALTLEEAL